MTIIRFFWAVIFLVVGVFSFSTVSAEEEDPFLSYEETDQVEVMAWVRAQNARTVERLQKDDLYQDYYDYIMEQINSKDRLVLPSIYRDTNVILNFWRDADHPQGIIRESTLEKFFEQNPEWQTVVDLDALSAAEGKTWVYGGASRYFYDYRRVMIALSDGGKDAVEYREFDYGKKEFVKDGFFLKESKSGVVWLDEDTLLVASAFESDGPTASGYPKVIKKWSRGTPFSEAEAVFTCEDGDLSAASAVYRADGDEPVFVIIRRIDLFHNQSFLYRDGGLEEILIPRDASLLGFYKQYAFVWLKTDWDLGGETYLQDSIVYFPVEQMTGAEKEVAVLYEPAPSRSFQGVNITDEYLYLSYLEDVRSNVEQYRLEDGKWVARRLPLNEMETASLVSTPRKKGFVLLIQSGFTNPSTLYLLDEETFEKRAIQSLPHRFDPDAYTVAQEFAESADGTRVPYFVVHKKDMAFGGDNPVLQYGYGGFLTSLLPGYSAVQEHCWLRDGGVYVMANIRGGGEYGPWWHQQALKRNRFRAFEDFIAVSEDLIRKGYTNSRRLGIGGGSNGGLLTGAVMTMRPELYNAVLMEVPLLDMLRYHKLPPGASWMGEYGDPDDPADREALRAYSPYHNLRSGVDYPPPFLSTSTKDDRVHPGHARKFARRLEEFKEDFYYYEELDGGHSGNANLVLAAKREAMKWVYLHKRLMGDGEK